MKENEYNYLIEYEARIASYLPCIPVLFAAFLNEGPLSQRLSIGIILAGLALSLIILFSTKISRDLFQKVPLFKTSVIAHYFLTAIIPITLFFPHFRTPLNELIGTISFAVGLCFGLVLYFHFYAPKYLDEIGWFTKDPAILTQEAGSKTGNKVALILVFLTIAVIIFVTFVVST